MALSIPLALGITAWQSARFSALKRDIERNNRLQLSLVEQNKRLITEISQLSSSYRIGKFAREQGLDTKKPENVIHVLIEN